MVVFAASSRCAGGEAGAWAAAAAVDTAGDRVSAVASWRRVAGAGVIAIETGTAAVAITVADDALTRTRARA